MPQRFDDAIRFGTLHALASCVLDVSLRVSLHYASLLALSFKPLRDQPEIMSRSEILRSAFLLQESFDRFCFITINFYFVTLSNRLVLFVHKIALMVTRMV